MPNEWYEGPSDEDEEKSLKSEILCSPKRKPKRKRKRSTFNFKRFPRYEEIVCWLKKLEVKYPNRVTVEKIGRTIQKRPIYMIILKGCQRIQRVSVMLEAGIHAREWLSPTTVIYFINYVIKHPRHMNMCDFYIIPCLNPDGYEFTHTTLRLWRKNMNKNGFRNIGNWGVDLNRNFPFAYGLPGSSPCPASVMYRGKHGLSEPESQSLANALNKYGKYIQLYVAVHAYGNLIMYPWGYTYEPICDEEELKECGETAARAMKEAYPNSLCFRVGKLSEQMYLSSGGSSDYARGIHKIKFSYTIELHRGGKSGFEAKVCQILSVAREVKVGLKAMIEYVYNYYFCKGLKRKAEDNCVYCAECKRLRTL